MEGDDIIETSTEEVVISEDDEHRRNKFYTDVEKYKNSLSLCMREKSMITMVLYNNIINALKQTKGGKKVGIDSRFHTWCKTYFRIDMSAGIELLISSKNSNRVVVVEHYYQILKEVHLKTGHSGRDKMRHEVTQHYYWIPTKIINI